MNGQQNNNNDSIQKIQELDEVILSINKWEQKINEVPNKIVKVNFREARLQNPQTTADLLGMTGSVYIQKSQLGGGSPMIRGFSTNRVLIVVDGVRMNNAIYRSGNLQNIISVDALSTESAEIIFGPGSIIYGSDAIGGVMDFHSLQPRYATGKKVQYKANALIRYSSANNERTGHIDFTAGSKRLAYLGSITYSDFDDLKMGKHGGQSSYLRTNYVSRIVNKDSIITNNDPEVQKFTGYTQLNVLQKLRFKAAEKTDIQYTFHYSGTGNVPRYDRLIERSGSTPSFAEWYYGPQIWRMHALQITDSRKNILYHSARVVFGYQNYEESRHDRRFNNANLRNQFEQVKIFSSNLDLNKMITDNSELFYGAEFITNHVGSFANSININTGSIQPTVTRYPNNSKWNSYGIYSNFKSNIKQFTFNAGVRYNYVTVYTPFDTSLFKFPFTKAELDNGAFTGNLGVVYRPTTKSQLNFNFATGFRVPNVDDLGKVFESAPGQLTVPNPDLKSEYAYNLDLGYATNIHDNIKFDITCFYTLLNDAVVRRASTFNSLDSVVYEGVKSKVFSLQNAARARVYGVQAGLEICFSKNLAWSVQGNWIEGKETADNNEENVPLRHAPPFYGNMHIKFNTKKCRLDVYALWNSEISNKDLAPSEQAKSAIYATDKNGNPYSPSWYTINLKTSYQLTTSLQVTAGWENITNQRYRTYSSGIVSPGSNLIFSVRTAL
jgi:hemoglobin/transferrin/lactoferrin receptor protein